MGIEGKSLNLFKLWKSVFIKNLQQTRYQFKKTLKMIPLKSDRRHLLSLQGDVELEMLVKKIRQQRKLRHKNGKKLHSFTCR